jgi:arabinose-5-phosphate isomerase
MKASIKAIALKTIDLEATSIAGLKNFVDESLERVVEKIFQSKGRLVVSGIGKSGIVAQKIVATLNSTGTPSIFMHAADAIHGDLGMVQPNDLVMLISKSGESPEIKVLVPLILERGNTLIGMVGNLQSYLAQSSQHILNTSVTQEACPNNLAPTSSTTAQMVMGDVLAVCLMELRGFKETDFARFHPGGNLGKRLYLRVEDVYTRNERPQVEPNAGIRKVIVEMTNKRLGVTAVVDASGKATGIITDGDLRRMLERTETWGTMVAKEIMSPNPTTITSDALAVEAMELFRKKDITQLLVVDINGKYLGVLHLHDLVEEGIF